MLACDEAAVLDTPEKRGRPTDHIADLVAMEAAVVYEELTEHHIDRATPAKQLNFRKFRS